MDTPRRRVLSAAAAGSTLGLAGCGDLAGSDGDAGSDPDAVSDGDAAGQTDGGEEARATIALDVQSEIQAAREEIGTRVDEGNLSREDARAELRDAQAAIIAGAVEDVRAYATDIDDLAVENANEQAGAVLVSGSAAAVLGALDADPVSALLSAADFPEPREAEQPNGS